MLLAVELDNSNINFGLFEDASAVPTRCFKLSTDISRTSDEYALTVAGLLDFYGVDRDDISAAVISSVVPVLTDVIAMTVKILTGIDALIVGKGTKTGFPIKIDNPSELGADLVANAAAVIDICKREQVKKMPCIIIDMGTATTVFAINSNGEYIGGSILPGVGMSLDTLHGGTAQLPIVSPTLPTRAIGRSSQEAMRSGVILGNAMMVDGFIDKFALEMKAEDGHVFVTGEYAESVISFCTHKMRHVPELTLMGLFCIYNNNLKF